MLWNHRSSRILGVSLVILAGAVPALRAEDAQQKFYHAYFLENGQSDYAGAAKLYGEVVRDRGVDAALRSTARFHLAACQEEIASTDFARLMPANAIAYVELNRPGDQLMSLLKQLGILADPEKAAADAGKRFTVSPALIKAVLGLRGAAVAITGIDMERHEPTGVVVLHPGDLEVIRGLIETALPVGGKPVKSIGGYATYDVEGEVLITLTKRLVIASKQRSEIEGVIARLKGDEDTSLATNADLKEVLRDRDDSMLFFCVNAKPVLPLLKMALAAGASQSKEAALALALLDPDSLRTLSGRAGVGDDGLFLEIALRLEKGHRNLVYNLLRMPAIDAETLRSVPQGAAAFFALALNESGSRYNASGSTGSDEPAIVTGLDFFREVFANIVGISVYALPPSGEPTRGGPPIPNVGVAISVHDATKSAALWSQILGIASMATGHGALEGDPVQIAGTQVRSFALPEGITIYFVTQDNDLLISPSRDVIARSLKARRAGSSIMKDPAFASSIDRIGPDSTIAMFVHAGRCAELAKAFMSPQEVAEMEPFTAVLGETVASLVVDHSGQKLQLSARLTGIPEIGGLISDVIASERQKHEARRVARRQRAEIRRLVADGSSPESIDRALRKVDEMIVSQPKNLDLLRTKFDVLAWHKNDIEAANACGALILAQASEDATYLNNFAWALLTEERYEGRYEDLALKLSQHSNELSGRKNWMFVDTLALARFETGDVEAAIALENKAIELSNGTRVDELKAALARFETARTAAVTASVGGS